MPQQSGRSRTATSTNRVPNAVNPSRVLAWDVAFLTKLSNAASGDSIQFPLPGGQTAAGKIGHLRRSNGNVIYASGELTEPEAGRFFFQQQSSRGVAGDFVGVVEFPASRRAYRIEPTGPGGEAELVERRLEEVLCVDLPRPGDGSAGAVEKIPPLNPADFPDLPVPDYQNGVPVLESLPGATAVIYLDFQGGFTAAWGGIAYGRPAFNDMQIREVWQRVAEDFLPFRINVVTDLQIFQSASENSRQRVIITPTDTATPGAGGVAYMGSFNWTGDTPCWVFVTNNAAYCAQAASHETGHTLGLSHAGRFVNGTYSEYYAGHGSGETGWAPLMGLGYYRNVTQWSKGEYADADNPQDQLAVIASQNNVRHRADDTGEALATARWLEIYDDLTTSAEGVIETTADTDAFQFTTAGGDVSLRANPVSLGPNLALEVALFDSADQLITSDSPQWFLGASISTNIPAGTYTFRVTGSGRNNPLTDGFTTYASLGYYSVTGSVANARRQTRFGIPENLPNGTTLGTVPANNPNNDPLAYVLTAGNFSGTFALNNSGVLSVVSNAFLDYEALGRNSQLPVQVELFVDILNSTNPGLSETNRRVVVAVTNVNEPPTLSAMRVSPWAIAFLGGGIPGPLGGGLGGNATFSCFGSNCTFRLSVLEHTPPGTVLGTMLGADPDSYTRLSYSIIAGNSNGLFEISSASGEITIAGDLVAATRNLHELRIAVSDQTAPLPLTATATVIVSVELPYRRGSIAYAVYTNVSGTFLGELTNAPSFPRDPALEKQVARFEADIDRGDDFGAVMRGYLLPPATGSYKFWIASRNNSELWLGNSTNPAAMMPIAQVSADGGTDRYEWTKYPGQESASILLPAGHAYYIEARMKAGTGADHLAVAWECAEAGITREIIPGQYLAPHFMNYVPHPKGFSANLRRDAISGSRLGTVTVADINSKDRHALGLTSGNEAGLFDIDSRTGSVQLINEAALAASTQAQYQLEVLATDDGVPPLSGSTIVTILLVPTNALPEGFQHQEVWTNLGAASLSALTSHSSYPKRPAALRALTEFDSGIGGFSGNCGSRIRACVTPPDTGLYTFFIASDDESQLKFSHTSNAMDAAIIAWVDSPTGPREWTRNDSQRSGEKWLVAGQRYYLETLQQHSGGQGHVAVGWAGPGISGTSVISGTFLSAVDIEFPPELADGSLNLSLAATNGTLVTTLVATDSPLDALTYKILSGNVSNTFALDPETGQLVVADNRLLADYSVTNFNLVIQVQDSGYAGLYPLKSAQASLNVRVVDDTPAFTWNGSGADNNWSTDANWTTGRPKNGSKLTFTGSIRRTNRNDLLQRVGLVRLYNGGFRVEGNPLVLAGGFTSSGNNTWAVNSVLDGRQTFTTYFGTTTVAGSIANNGHDLTLIVSDTLRLEGVLSGTGGLFVTGGKLLITGQNTYTGPTVITSHFVLTNSGSISGSSNMTLRGILDGRGLVGGLTIVPGQTLKGQGVVLGPVTIAGTLAPDLQPAGLFVSPAWFTFSNRLVLAGDTRIQIRSTSSPLPQQTNYGNFLVSDELELGGRLIVTNLDSTATLVAGKAFKLFSAARFTNWFANMKLPPLSAGLRWDSSRLAVDGTIRVTASPPLILPPQFLPLISTNGSIVIRIQTVSGFTYVLESAASLPAANWTVVGTRSGTGGLVTFSIPVDPAATQRFFRVRIN